MNINIYQLLSGAEKAAGLTVVIDVFRAFSVDAYVFNNGAEQIIPVASIERAYKLKENNPHYLLMGEREGKIQPGFDYPNSPSAIQNKDFNGKTVIHTTSAGTQGLIKASRQQVDELVTGSFVNIGAIIEYIKSKNPEELSLIAMGVGGRKSAEEDIFCARYIKNHLERKPNNFPEMVEKIKKGSGSRFFDKEKSWSPRPDFDLCLDINKFNFVIRAQIEEEPVLFPVDNF